MSSEVVFIVFVYDMFGILRGLALGSSPLSPMSALGRHGPLFFLPTPEIIGVDGLLEARNNGTYR